MGLADRVLPEHIQRAGALEKQLREYMKNQKMLEQQSNRAMNNREVTTALELQELSNKQKEEAAAAEKELIGLYKEKQKRDYEKDIYCNVYNGDNKRVCAKFYGRYQ